MTTLKVIANRFLSQGLKPKVRITDGGKVCAGYGVFNEDKKEFEIPVFVRHENHSISFSRWELNQTPIIEKRDAFSFIGTVEELAEICNSDLATINHHNLLRNSTELDGSISVNYG